MTMLRSFNLKPAQPIYLIIALAFLIRLGWIVFAPALPTSDFAWYDQVADQVVQGRGYSVGGSPTAFRVPGYPLFLAGIYIMFERSLFFAKLANVLLGTLTVFLVYLLGRRRNYRVFDRLVPLATDGGINLLVSFNEKSVGRFVPGVHAHIEERARQEGWDKEQLEQAILEETLDFIRRHPVRAIGLAPLKVFHLFRDDVSGVIWNFSETSRPLPQWLRWVLLFIAQGYYIMIIALALATVFFRKSLAAYAWYGLLLTPILYWIAFHLVFFGDDRYHIPILPLICIFSAFGALRTVETVRATRKEGAPSGLSHRQFCLLAVVGESVRSHSFQVKHPDQ